MLSDDERQALQLLSGGPIAWSNLAASCSNPAVLSALEKLALIQKVSSVASGGRPTFATKPTFELTLEGALRLKVEIGGHEVLFIRLGHWCSCGASWNANKNTLESGISAFECYQVAVDQYLPSLDHAWRKDAESFRRQATNPMKQWYLVAGTRIGTGGDQEPLLKDVEFKALLVEAGGSFGSSPTPPGKRLNHDPSHQACGGSPCP